MSKFKSSQKSEAPKIEETPSKADLLVEVVREGLEILEKMERSDLRRAVAMFMKQHNSLK